AWFGAAGSPKTVRVKGSPARAAPDTGRPTDQPPCDFSGEKHRPFGSMTIDCGAGPEPSSQMMPEPSSGPVDTPSMLTSREPLFVIDAPSGGGSIGPIGTNERASSKTPRLRRSLDDPSGADDAALGS